MDAPPERAGTPTSTAGERPATRLEVAGRLLLGEPRLGFRVELAEPGLLGLRSRDGRAALLEHDETRPFALAHGLGRIHARAYPARHLIVFGGGAAVRQRLEQRAAEPDDLWVLHVDGDDIWHSRAPRLRERRLCGALERAAAEAEVPRNWSASEADAHLRRVQHDREQARADAREVERFRLLIAARKPRATFCLMACIAAMFGLEALWGGVDLPPLLSAMGSLAPERARAGEWWRFFACSFLHGGLLHVGLNLLVLWMLGRSLERVIGSTRFLLVYFGAALAGSIGSCLMVVGQSVGASGAIWGLLGAEAAMAFYPQPLLPPVLLPVARRTALTNLGVNLAASFVPRVDMAAHIGGGIAGALVLLLLARSGQLGIEGPVSRRAQAGVRAFALLLVLAFGVGVATAQHQGRPWQLKAPPELERASAPGWPWSVELPRGYAATRDAEAVASIEFGDLLHDPSVVQIQWASLTQRSARAELDVELDELGHELESAEGVELLAPPRLVTRGGDDGAAYVGVRYRYAQSPELVDEWAIGVRDGVRVRVHVSAWAALPHASDGLAPRVLHSLGPAAAARADAVFHPGATAAR